jgi:uncharacterized protein YbjT (DUF2867 family)
MMSDEPRQVLVFGATGQQGGSVATALLRAGWSVRAFVRDPASPKAAALRSEGAELVRGNFTNTDSMRSAMAGAYGVFSVQPSSGQGPVLGISDEEEERYGVSIANLARDAGVQHFVYTSVGVPGDEPTGMPHFDTKLRIEKHIRDLPLTATIVRPVAFMDMLVMPGFGLDRGVFTSFAQPDQPVQFLAVEDIGKFVAAIFADPARFGGTTLEIASDAVTGRDLGSTFTEAAGRPIRYERFSADVLAANPFLAKLTELFDSGRLVGHADLVALRALNPEMQSFRSWLGGSGRQAFEHALRSSEAWAYGSA